VDLFIFIFSKRMTQGFVSNYNDSGYTINVNTYFPYTPIYFTDGTSSSSNVTVSRVDIYLAGTQSRVGVYMIDGVYGNCDLYPIICCMSNLNYFGVPTESDDAWLIYPGYGIQLYNQDPTKQSYVYYNITSSPKVIGCTNWAGPGTTIIRYSNLSTTSGFYPQNSTYGILVYFRNALLPTFM